MISLDPSLLLDSRIQLLDSGQCSQQHLIGAHRAGPPATTKFILPKMQRALRRNILARNQALKRQRKQSEETLREEAHEVRREKFAAARVERSAAKAERTYRREDWMLGPLAPNRLVGKDGGGYGMLDFLSAQAPTVMKREREKYVNIVVNDRVVVVSGREKGKIGKVGNVNVERQTVALYDINLVSFLHCSVLIRNLSCS